MEGKPAIPGLGGGCVELRRVAVLALALAALPATVESGDPEASAAGIRNRALGFEAIPGGPAKRIVLKPEMAAKLGIETAPVRPGKPGAVPVGAVFYDAKGNAWVYVGRRSGVFAGQRVRVENVVDGEALLSDGPPAGTPVVSVGTAALGGAGIFGR